EQECHVVYVQKETGSTKVAVEFTRPARSFWHIAYPPAEVPVSQLCEELGLRPTVFYRWRKELFENGAAAFQSQEHPHRQVEEKQKRIEFLEKKVQIKDEVLAELMAEHIALKKHLGNSNRWLGTA